MSASIIENVFDDLFIIIKKKELGTVLQLWCKKHLWVKGSLSKFFVWFIEINFRYIFRNYHFTVHKQCHSFARYNIYIYINQYTRTTISQDVQTRFSVSWAFAKFLSKIKGNFWRECCIHDTGTVLKNSFYFR